jgi:hypothetical protein
MSFVHRAMKNRASAIVVSVILALGLATMFQKVCKDNCVVIQAPRSEYVTSHVWSIDDTCYSYKLEPAECGSAGGVIEAAGGAPPAAAG